MGTVQKGDAFEKGVYTYLKEELENDRLHVVGRNSEIFSKKSYYSRDRGDNIIVDISIETFVSGASDYSLLTVVECKSYDSPIPVDDIEEFHSKVQQIAGDNVKAIFVTKSALQKSALSYAKSKKMGIIRYMPSDQIKWLAHLMTSANIGGKVSLNQSEFNSAFLNQNHISYDSGFYACDGTYIYGSLFSLLKEFLN
jgi:hypothetical protein